MGKDPSEKKAVYLDELMFAVISSLVIITAYMFTNFVSKDAFSREVQIRSEARSLELGGMRDEIKAQREDIKRMDRALARALPNYHSSED